MFLANFIFGISHLKIHLIFFHLNTSKAQRHFNQKEKFIKTLLAFVINLF